MKSMTKYQLDHFKDKVKRQFQPMIEEQELLVRQYKTEATDKAVSKLSRAALVVLLFDLVATLIPRKPANPEAKAPTTKWEYPS